MSLQVWDRISPLNFPSYNNAFQLPEGVVKGVRAGASLLIAVQETFGQDEIVKQIEQLKVQAIDKPNDIRVQLACGTSSPFKKK